MPFTLAHPAAILPLRRYCPKYLSLAGLIIGSIVPDTGYLFTPWNGGSFAHTFLGSLVYCLPVGVVLLVLFYGFQAPVVNRLPERPRRLFQRFCKKPLAHPAAILVSVLLGVWLHQFWDACTHGDSWVTIHIPIMNEQMTTFGDHIFYYCHLVLYISSFIGVAFLYAAYDKWRTNNAVPATPRSRAARWTWALFIAALTMPLEAVHHIIGSLPVFVIVGVASLVLIVAIGLNLDLAIKWPRKRARSYRPIRR